MPSGKHNNHARGAKNGRWNGSKKILSSHGYVKVRVGKKHPLADPHGYAYEHLLVWVSAGNARPNKRQVLHHVNEDKTDNRLENLKLAMRPDHSEYHLRKTFGYKDREAKREEA